MSLAALAAGSDGLLLEVHPSPDQARNDGAPSVTFEQFRQLKSQIQALTHAFGRTMTSS
jgi:3-deoxy-7-phosphoheptulonate synthase